MWYKTSWGSGSCEMNGCICFYCVLQEASPCCQAKWCRWAWPSTLSVTADPGIHCILCLIISKAVWKQASMYAAWLIRGLGSVVKQQVNHLGKIYAQIIPQVWAHFNLSGASTTMVVVLDLQMPSLGLWQTSSTRLILTQAGSIGL